MTSSLGQTASITLLTALPGSGKTLRLVGWIKRAVADGEIVYVSNLNGLKLPHIPLEDPRDWQSLPAGSVLVVDEAQQFFRARRGGEPPEYLTAMETIRHKGIRLILATQQPNYLDAHLRGLVGLHEHLVRVNGKEAAKIYRHHEVIEDVRSEKGRSRYDSEDWAFPAEDFALYESAEVHTVKYRMSSRMKRGIAIAAVVLVGMGYLAYTIKRDFVDPATAEAKPSQTAASRQSGWPAGAASGDLAPMSAAQYAAKFVPRVPAMPQSAPAYDGRQVVSSPRLFCMSSGSDGQGGCSCTTEQGSRYQTDAQTCRYIARWGEAYDPYRSANSSRGAGGTPAAMTPSGGALVGADATQAANGAVESFGAGDG